MSAVDDGFDEQLDFIAELVRFPSTRGNEHTAQDFMARALAERELDVDRWRIDVGEIEHLPGFSPVAISYENSFNVVGAHRAEAAKGRSLILNGHIDVVPEGPHDMWTHHPYEPARDGNWMYGRGSGDMKAGLVNCLYAYDALHRAGFEPTADVYIQSVVEEECTGNGALACLARGYRAEAAIIPEPSAERVGAAQTGTIWFQVEVRGWPVHASRMTTGANAIDAAFALIQGLRKLEECWNSEKDKHPHFAEHRHPINFNVGKIVGGEWPASVPAQCIFDVRAAIFPGDSIPERCREIEICIRETAAENNFLRNDPPKITYHGFFAEGYELDQSHGAVKVLEAAHKCVSGQDLERLAFTGTTDARFFGLYAGIPGMVYGPSAESVHGYDERVDLESVRRNTQSIAIFMAEWCGIRAR